MGFLKSFFRSVACGSCKPAFDEELFVPVPTTRPVPIQQTRPVQEVPIDIIPERRSSRSLETKPIRTPKPPKRDIVLPLPFPDDKNVLVSYHNRYPEPTSQPLTTPVIQIVQRPHHVSPRLPVAIQASGAPVAMFPSRSGSRSRTPTPDILSGGPSVQRVRTPSPVVIPIPPPRPPTPAKQTTVVVASSSTPKRDPSYRKRVPSAPPAVRRHHTIGTLQVEAPPLPRREAAPPLPPLPPPPPPPPEPLPLKEVQPPQRSRTPTPSRRSSQKKRSRPPSPARSQTKPESVRSKTPQPQPPLKKSKSVRIRSPSAPPPLRLQETIQVDVPPLPKNEFGLSTSPPKNDSEDDAAYTFLRNKARSEGDAMRQCFEDSQKAFKAGQKALAKDLSNKGRAHKTEMEKLNKEAAEYIYKLNNVDSAPDEIDLHGLYVKEAIDVADKALDEAKKRGSAELRIIVGKGLHSQNSVVKLRPAIEGLMVKHRLNVSPDPRNAGVLVVPLSVSSRSRRS